MDASTSKGVLREIISILRDAQCVKPFQRPVLPVDKSAGISRTVKISMPYVVKLTMMKITEKEKVNNPYCPAPRVRVIMNIRARASKAAMKCTKKEGITTFKSLSLFSFCVSVCLSEYSI